MNTLIKTLKLKLFSVRNIPLLFITSPKIIKITGTECQVKIPLNYWTKNHLGSMYFGALAIGADLAGGLIAFFYFEQLKANVQLVFQDFNAQFLKRPVGDVVFTCKNGKAIRASVEETIKTKERISIPVEVIATTPEISGDEPVGKFVLTLSLKGQ